MGELHHGGIDPFTLADALEAGIVVHGADTAILYANRKALDLLRLTPDEAIGKTAFDPHWQFLDNYRRPLRPEHYPVNEVIAGNAAVKDRLLGIVDRRSIRTRWINVSAYPQHDASGRLKRVVVTFVDVTGHIRAEKLRDAQLDIATKANQLAEEPLLQLVLGWCEEITGSTVSFFHFVNDDQESIELVTWSERTLKAYCLVEELNRHYPISEAGIWAEAARTKCPVIVNDYAQAAAKRGLPEGHARLERFISMPLLEGGKVRVLLGVGNKAYAYTDDDVQDLKILTDQIWRIVGQKRTASRARELAQAVEQTPAMIVMTDTAGAIRYVNPAFTEVTGYTLAEVAGQTPSVLKSDQNNPDLYADLWSTIASGKTWSKRLQNRKKDGTLYWTTTVISPLRDAGDEIIGYLGVGEDVTEQVQLEDQLRQAQKMEAVGQLTGGIAHDFNNYLAIIIGNLQLLDEDIARSEGATERRELIADALWSAERGAELTGGLLAFARQQTLYPASTDINRVVVAVTRLLKRTLGEGVEVETDLDDYLWPAMVDRGQLETALVNLAVNARDAMPDGGKLRVTTGNVEIAPGHIVAGGEAVPGAYVTLRVADTGTGMAPEVRDRIFEPFFTTKRFGRGSGLGLSMVYGFVSQTGGHVAVDSAVGGGTAITLYLPRAAAIAETLADSRPETPGDAESREAAGEVILVVEDDERVRRIAVKTLRAQGYRVMEASRAAEALDVLDALDGEPRVALLFTDVLLPEGGNGAELAAVVRQRWPGTRVLLTSGYAQAAEETGSSLDDHRLLVKPYRHGELVSAVREILDQPMPDRHPD